MKMEALSVRDILSTQDIIIPEIQREYVWGNNKQLLEQFIRDITTAGTDINVGFLYSYMPEQASHSTCFLIDGQQRFTTLVLILYYLSIKEKRQADFNGLLKCSGTHMSFSYRVRSTTDNFLRKLFSDNTWFTGTGIEKQIKNKGWYTTIYDNDPSIQTILKSLQIIDEKLRENSGPLYDTIAGKVRFWYFNVKDTSQGEELYITMNSRGEILQPYENIKPLLFEKLCESGLKSAYHAYGKQWDTWEEFFYSLNEGEDIRQVDTGINNFLRTVIELLSCKEHDKIKPAEDILEVSLTLSSISDYYQALEKIKGQYPEQVKQLFEKGDLYVLKGLLTVYVKENRDERDPLRIYKTLENGCRRKLVNNVPLLKFLRKFRNSNLPFYDFIHTQQEEAPEELQNVFDQHELNKINIYRQTGDPELEELFWQAEAHPVTNGSLKCIWYEKFSDNDAIRQPWTTADKNTFRKRFGLFQELFKPEHIRIPLSTPPQQNIIDNSLIARALITIDDYTINTGGRNWCFGFSDRWKDIMNTPKSYPVVSGLIDQLSEDDSPVSLYDKLRKIIDNYLTNYDLNKKDSRYYIAKYPDSLQAMHDGHNIIFFEAGWDNYWIDVINKDRMSSYHINLFRYLVYKYYPLTKDFNQWLELKNGLTLDCAEQHGWCIKYSDKVKTEFVEEQFKGYPLKPNREEKLFFIPVDLKEDLIEAGIGILEKMTQIP